MEQIGDFGLGKSVWSYIRKTMLRPSPRFLSYSVLGFYAVATVASFGLTVYFFLQYSAQREVLMGGSRVSVYDIEWTEIQLQMIGLCAVAASVFFVLSVKLFTEL
jgi:hypothetical protein